VTAKASSKPFVCLFIFKEFAMSIPIPRRVFMMTLATGSAVLVGAARAQTMVDDKDPQSVALGYVSDAKRADAKKFPKYAAGQLCSNCVLYQGKATDKAAGCPLFAGKQVAGLGWCSAWAKKS
jgi:High potential iron-sulfur protein